MAEKKIKRLKSSAQIEFVEKKSVFIGFSTIVKKFIQIAILEY